MAYEKWGDPPDWARRMPDLEVRVERLEAALRVLAGEVLADPLVRRVLKELEGEVVVAGEDEDDRWRAFRARREKARGKTDLPPAM